MEEIITLLKGPFVLAESFAARYLNETGNKAVIDRIREISSNAQSEFVARIINTDNVIDVSQLSMNLNIGLYNFFRDFEAFFHASHLPTKAWDKMPQWIFFFPAETELDWRKLLDLFLRLWRDLPKPDESIVSEYIQIGFGLTCQHLAFLQSPYDENIVFQHLTEMGDRLGEYYREFLFYSLKQYDHPPLQSRYLEVCEMIAFFQEQKIHVEKFETPPFGNPRDKLILPLEAHIISLDSLIKLHEAKANRLLATIKKENNSSINLSDNHVLPIDTTPISGTETKTRKKKSKQEGSQTDLDYKPTLFIKAGAQEKLLRLLTDLLVNPKEDKDKLKCLLNREKIIGAIKIKCSLGAWSWVFRDAYKYEDLDIKTTPKGDTGAWIAYWFERKKSKGVDQWVKLTESTVLDCLGKTDKAMPKDAISYR
jgi:hypothetical protein